MSQRPSFLRGPLRLVIVARRSGRGRRNRGGLSFLSEAVLSIFFFKTYLLPTRPQGMSQSKKSSSLSRGRRGPLWLPSLGVFSSLVASSSQADCRWKDCFFYPLDSNALPPRLQMKVYLPLRVAARVVVSDSVSYPHLNFPSSPQLRISDMGSRPLLLVPSILLFVFTQILHFCHFYPGRPFVPSNWATYDPAVCFTFTSSSFPSPQTPSLYLPTPMDTPPLSPLPSTHLLLSVRSTPHPATIIFSYSLFLPLAWNHDL